MTSCPICNHVNPPGTARCEGCDTWLAQAADLGLKSQVPMSPSSAKPPALKSPLNPAFAEELLTILRAGRKIEAIALFREATGLGLRESKAAVEALETGRPLPASDPTTTPAGEELLLTLLRSGNFIGAIKQYRLTTGAGLKASKQAVEALAARHGIELPKPMGCSLSFSVLLVTVGLGLGLLLVVTLR